MRHLSFTFVITLLCGFVVALPTGGRTGEENTSLTYAPPSASPERRVLGRIVRRNGNNHPAIGSIIKVPVLAHQTHDQFGNRLPDNLKAFHHGVVTHVKENPDEPDNPHVGVAIISHRPEKNPDFKPDQATKYVKGVHKNSKIHVGKPFEVPLKKTEPSRANFTVHNLPGLLSKVNGHDASGQQQGHQAAGKPAKPTPPNSGAQRGRNPNPPQQGVKRQRGGGRRGGGGKRKVGSGGNV